MIISEKGLMKMCLVGAVLGLALLYFISENQKAEVIGVAQIDNSFVGKTINVTGTVSALKKTNSGEFFDLQDGNRSIKVVLWNNVLEEANILKVNIENLKEGAKINVVGLVDAYKGSVEIVPSRGSQIRIIG